MNEKTLNVHNYEEIKKKQLEIGDDVYEHLEVYEKEYKLADRTVKALVEDNSAREESPYMNILFVYDGALIQVKVITDNDEEILSTLSFTHKSLE